MTNQLSKIHISEISKKSLCDGYLYYTSGSKKILLLKPANLISKNFIQKYALAGTTFDFFPISELEIGQKFSRLFKELKYLHFEKDLQNKASHIVEEFLNSFSQNKHFFSFSQVCYEEFCAEKSLQSEILNETDVNLFIKSFYSSSLAILLALSNGIHHYPMLKDVYNLSFCLDIGLCDENYSFFIAEACNYENKLPGTGLDWLKTQNISQNEIDIFFNHPIKSYDFFIKNALLNFSELSQAILFQHELADGRGFPRGIHHSQISVIESILILADAMVEIKDDDCFKEGIIEHIQNFDSKKLDQLPVKRTLNKLLNKIKTHNNLESTGS